MKISLCIPTYNRATHLNNCLQSIVSNRLRAGWDVEVCISDNCSTDQTEQVVNDAKRQIPIKYQRNSTNLGLARNFLKVVEMAEGEFVWMIGDDDLLMPGALDELIALINHNKDVDYFYVNSNHLATEYVLSFPQPFDLSHLPKQMTPFSPRKKSGEVHFLDLIDPKISFDFLGGIFLSVFRRDKWLAHVCVLDEAALSEPRTFSRFDNTFPHIKIFASAYPHSKAYFCAKPLSVCLTGAREWGALYPLVKSVRLIEALQEYKKNGLPLLRYVYCKNSALGTFANDFVRMILDKERSGYDYINPIRLIVSNLLYPNFYLSFFYPFFRKSFWEKLKNFFTHFAPLIGKPHS